MSHAPCSARFFPGVAVEHVQRVQPSMEALKGPANHIRLPVIETRRQWHDWRECFPSLPPDRPDYGRDTRFVTLDLRDLGRDAACHMTVQPSRHRVRHQCDTHNDESSVVFALFLRGQLVCKTTWDADGRTRFDFLLFWGTETPQTSRRYPPSRSVSFQHQAPAEPVEEEEYDPEAPEM